MMLYGQDWLVSDIIHPRKVENIHNSQGIYTTQCNLSGPGKDHIPDNGKWKQENEAVEDDLGH